MTFRFASAEVWEKRMRRIQDKLALDQSLVVVVGSGLSFDRSKQRGVADVTTLVEWIRADGIEFEVAAGQNEYQAAIEAFKTERSAREVSELLRRGVLDAYRGNRELVTKALGSLRACRQRLNGSTPVALAPRARTTMEARARNLKARIQCWIDWAGSA